MKKSLFKNGITLVELAIGALIASLLLGGIMSLFSSSMSGSRKGMSHLANMEAAIMLMTQIEYDLTRAYSIDGVDFKGQSSDSSNDIKAFIRDNEEDTKNKFSVVYKRNDNGSITRELLKNNSKESSHVFCKGFIADIEFTPIVLENPHSKYGVYIVLNVQSSHKTVGEIETFTLKRLIMCRNMVD